MATTSTSNMFQDDLEEIIGQLNWEELSVESAVASGQSSVSSSEVTTWMLSILAQVQNDFSFSEAAKMLVEDSIRVSEAAVILQTKLSQCLVKRSNIDGFNREASQTAFFKMSTDRGFRELSKVVGDVQLTMYLALEVFTKLLDTCSSNQEDPKPLVGPITNEERDIAHYIGGAVIRKLKNKSKEEEEFNTLSAFVSEDPPAEGTLLNAKSRGRLTNMTSDGKGMFVELEQVFRDTFTCVTAKVNAGDYKAACYKNKVIQDCFYSSVAELDNVAVADKVLSDIVQLYFTIRIHHKCKVMLDSVRARTKVSSKDRALRAKLSK